MKHAIYSCLAFVAVLLALTACSNDAIDIECSERADITLSISTSAPYDDFSITSSITSLLGEYDDEYVGVVSLLYNSEGSLVDSVCSYSRTLGLKTQSFKNVTAGTYTLVSVETIVSPDEDYESLVWELVDVDNLSTLRIENKGYYTSWYRAVGLHTQTLVVSNSAQTVSVSPEAIGCIIDISYENYDGSGYVWLGFELKDEADGRYLSPNMTGSNRWYYEGGYNATNTWNGMWNFYESTGLTDDDQTIYCLQTGSQEYCFGLNKNGYNDDGSINFTAYGDATTTFEDGACYVAYTYYTGSVETFFGTSGSSFDSWYAGVVEEASSNGASSSDVLDVPCTNWGASVSTVKSYMSSYTLEYEDDSFLGYYGQASSVDDIYYYFDDSYGLYMSLVWAYASALTNYEIAEELTTLGYTYLGENTDDDGNALLHLISNDYDTYVWIVDYTDDYSEWMVEFYPYELLSTKERSAAQPIELVAPKELKGKKTQPSTGAQRVSAPTSAGASSRSASLRLQQHTKAMR